MMHISFFIFGTLACLFIITFEPVSSCSPTVLTMVTTPPPGRRRRSINNDEIPNSLNILTKYEFDQKNNDKNANLLEAQFKKLVQNEKYNGSELQNRTISDDDGYLHISYSFPPNSEKYCYEIQDLYETAFYKIDQAAQALITCEV